MLEKFPKRKVAAVLSAGVGAFSLAGCGTDKQGAWRIGVSCPSARQAVHIENLTQTQLSFPAANFVIGCESPTDTLASPPTGLELLSGKGAVVHQPENITDVITVDYSWNSSDGCSPQIASLQTGGNQHLGSVTINCVDNVTSVSVGH